MSQVKKENAKIRNQDTYPCPLISKDIYRGECYDIQMIRYEMVVRDMPGVPEYDDDKAERVCEDCAYRQL